MKISVSIVDYGKGALVKKNIYLLSKQTLAHNIDLVIVDNSENKENFLLYGDIKTYESCFSSFTLVRPQKNIGYTLATNVSIDLSSDYCFLINPDIEIEDPMLLQKCIKHLKEDEKVGLVSVKHIDDMRVTENIARKFPSLKAQVYKRLPYFKNTNIVKDYVSGASNDSNTILEADWVQSSFWGLRTDTWSKLSGLDARFFLFMNEPDFCRRLKAINLKVHYLADLTVNTDGVRCSAGGFMSIFKSRTVRIHIVDAIRYYLKSYKKKDFK